MRTLFWSHLNSIVKCLHNNYGMGNILGIDHYSDGTVVVTAQGTSMAPHTRRGRVICNPKPGSYTVKMYGHQLSGIIVGETS